MRTAALAIVLLAAAGGDARAQTARPLADLDLAELMRIEVQSVFGASRFLQKVTDAPAAVSIVTARDIALYGYRTLADILRTTPGFNVTNDRNYSYVGVRGFQRPGDYNSRVLLMVDGHRLNDPIYDMAYLGTEFVLDLALIDRVEVIRGPSSSIYGANAFLAVINVITKKGRAMQGLHLSGSAGTFQARQGQAAFGTSFTSGLDVLVSASRFRTSGESRVYAAEFDDPATNNGIAQNLDGDATYRLFGSLSFEGLTLQGAYGARRKQVPTASFETTFNDARSATRDAQGWADLRYTRAASQRSRLTARLYYDQSAYDARFPYGTAGGAGPATSVVGEIARGGWWGTEVSAEATIAGRHKLTGGAEYRHNFRLHQKGFDTTTGVAYIDDRRSSRAGALFIEDQFSIHDTLLLNAGVRLDRYQSFRTTTNPRLGLIFKPRPQTAIKVLWGTAFRPPNAYETYYTSAFFGLAANLELGPERIRTGELVLERYFSEQYRVMVNVHASRVRGLISQTATASGSLVFVNLDSAVTRGVETEVEAKWASGLAGRVSYSYQRARDSVTNATLINSARHLATVNLTSPPIRGLLFTALDLHYVGPVRTLDGVFTRPFVVPNLTLTTRAQRGLTITASLRNVFDQRYGYPGGGEHRQNILYQEGRSGVAGLTFTWPASK